jgi:hypothetical protein
MATGRFLIDLPTANTPVTGSRGIQSGRLRGVSAISPSTQPVTNPIFVHAWLTKAGTTLEDSILELFSGYTDPSGSQAWDGSYFIEGDELLVAEAICDIVCNVTIIFNTDLSEL